MNNLAVLWVHEPRSCVQDIHARVWRSRDIIGRTKRIQILRQVFKGPFQSTISVINPMMGYLRNYSLTE